VDDGGVSDDGDGGGDDDDSDETEDTDEQGDDTIGETWTRQTSPLIRANAKDGPSAAGINC